MLGTTNIKVYLAPVIIGLVRDKCLVVVRVHVAQIVGRRTGKARHGIQLQRITVFGHPVLGAAQGRLTRLGGQEFVHLGQDERQFALVERLRLVVLVIVDGERLAPVALTAEDGVAQAVVHLHAAYAGALDIFLGACNGLFHCQAVELTADLELVIGGGSANAFTWHGSTFLYIAQ